MRSILLRVGLFAALSVFYVIGATTHAERVNTSKARGDQSGYLWDAQNVRANWNGQQPPVVIGQRNRMPVYAGFLALFWDPADSNEVFFEKAKRWNIYLSLGLLAILALLLPRYLPPLSATNLTLVVAFGYFVYRAGYTQSELLFYFLFFLTFLLFVTLLCRPATWTTAGLAFAAGGVAGVAHLTKASLLPLMGLVVVVLLGAAAAGLIARSRHAWRTLAIAAALTAGFLLVLSPYLQTNKKVFGRYFYNVNTTFYIWYNDWPEASVGTILHGDGVGWPTMPPEQLPSAARYWREHTLGQIAARVGGGLWDMVDRSYKTFWYFKYVVLYVGMLAAIAIKRRRELVALVRARLALTAFVLLYGSVYLLGVAFYHPISGTGTTRFLMAHLLPLLFTTAVIMAREPFRSTQWTLAGVTVGVQHFHLLISLTLAGDIIFTTWPRLMTTYGGF